MAGDLLARVRAEIDGRRAELRPHVAEYEKLLSAADALGLPLGETGASPPRARRKPVARSAGAAPAAAVPAARTATRPRRKVAAKAPASARTPRSAAQQAIAAALQHGSHTVAELAVVTGMSGADLRADLRRLLASGAVARARREGKTAYALAASPPADS
jgi:hypothetical protein